jgi:plastocyanin
MTWRHSLISGSMTGVLALTMWSCGGGGSPAGPSTGGGGGGGGTPVETTTITITSSGVSPASIIVNAGAKVMFVNNDSSTHEPSSNPHPSHTQCPELNIGSLPGGQSREGGTMVGGRTCGFHDHINPSNPSLMGTIQVR